MRDEQAFLQDIADSCEMIRRFVANRTFDAFRNDEMLQEAVQRRLGIIGEAARQLSDHTRACMAHVPWDQIIKMRNVLTHVYFSVNLDTVWQTAVRDVPELAIAIRPLLPPKKDDPQPT